MSKPRMHLAHLLRAGVVIGALVGSLAAPNAVLAHASSRDRDGDGLTNAFERLHSHTNPFRRDTDHDGIPDGRENPDHDGLTNREEQRTHTDPHDRDTDDDGLKDGLDDNDCAGTGMRMVMASTTRTRVTRDTRTRPARRMTPTTTEPR